MHKKKRHTYLKIVFLILLNMFLANAASSVSPVEKSVWTPATIALTIIIAVELIIMITLIIKIAATKKRKSAKKTKKERKAERKNIKKNLIEEKRKMIIKNKLSKTKKSSLNPEELKLKVYIEKNLKAGFSIDDIKYNCYEAGWKIETINKVILEIIK